MSRRLSPYSGGKESNCCDICGAPIYGRGLVHKCPVCAKKIAKKVTKEFYDNIGHEMTEAIMKTGDEKLIQGMIDGEQKEIPYGGAVACKIRPAESLNYFHRQHFIEYRESEPIKVDGRQEDHDPGPGTYSGGVLPNTLPDQIEEINRVREHLKQSFDKLTYIEPPRAKVIEITDFKITETEDKAPDNKLPTKIHNE